VPGSAFEIFAATPAPHLQHGPVPEFDHRVGRYRVRFAGGPADLEQVQRLRFEIFNLELKEGLDESWQTGLDRDRFDAQCQHLLVWDQEFGRAVGTYRLQTADAARAGAGFYSADEFRLDALPENMMNDSVELGRACIAREHRNRTLLFLLWRGLAAYVAWHRKRWFFGCNSLTSRSPDYGLRTWDWLRQNGYAHPLLRVEPQPAWICDRAAVAGASDPEAGRAVEIPTLFGIYLRYGGRVCGPPALDRYFKTVDFFTVLDLAAMDERTFSNFALDRA
jgi:putative hemolysin